VQLGEPWTAQGDQIYQTFSQRVKATDSILQDIVHNAPITCYFTIYGFRPIENVYAVSAMSFVHLGYHHSLTGDADSSTASKARLDASAANGFVESKRSAWVTRTQLKNIIDEYVERATVIYWRETRKDKQALEKARESFVKYLFDDARAKELHAAIDPVKNEINDPQVSKQDLAPDLITDLKNVIAARRKNDQSEKNEKTQTTKSTVREDDVTWTNETQGRQAEPKSIRLYQVNNAFFKRLYEKSLADIYANRFHEPRNTEALFLEDDVRPRKHTFETGLIALSEWRQLVDKVDFGKLLNSPAISFVADVEQKDSAYYLRIEYRAGAIHGGSYVQKINPGENCTITRIKELNKPFNYSDTPVGQLPPKLKPDIRGTVLCDLELCKANESLFNWTWNFKALINYESIGPVWVHRSKPARNEVSTASSR
jgi:hypothetical protein